MAELNVGKLVINSLKVQGQDEFATAEELRATVFAPRNASSGEAVFTTPGTFSFVVPEGVIKISALAVGAGGGGAQTWANSAGTGGGLAWADNIEVTAGDVISITVAARTSPQNNGGTSSVGSFFSATGGYYGSTNVGAPVSGTVQANGGNGGKTYETSWNSGGGGAGGYTGNGGNGAYGGSYNMPYNGSGGGGAGGGGYDSSTYAFGGGGGVGIDGEGTSGTWGSLPSQDSAPSNNGNSFYSDLRYAGAGGSGGENGAPNSNGSTTSNKGRTQYSGEGGDYGGGGGGAGTSLNNNSNFGRGGQGAVKIMWSTNSSFSIAEQ